MAEILMSRIMWQPKLKKQLNYPKLDGFMDEVMNIYCSYNQLTLYTVFPHIVSDLE